MLAIKKLIEKNIFTILKNNSSDDYANTLFSVFDLGNLRQASIMINGYFIFSEINLKGF